MSRTIDEILANANKGNNNVAPTRSIDEIISKRNPDLQTPNGRIIDGDTLQRPDGQRVRFAGGNAPERSGFGGTAASARAAELLKTGNFSEQISGKDHHGRLVGDYVNEDGETLSNILIREGYTVNLPQYRDHFAGVEAAAQREREFAERGSIRIIDDIGVNNDIPTPQEIYNDWRGWGERAWERGKIQMRGNAGAMASAIGNMTGIEQLEKYGDEVMGRAQGELRYNRPDVETYEDADTLTKKLKYVAETMVSNAPSTLTDVGVGILAAGTAPLTGGSSLAAAGTAMAARQAVLQTAKSRFAKGVAASMYTQMQGDSYQHLLDAGVDKEAAAATSLLVTGPINTALNYASFSYILGRMKIGDTSGAVKTMTDVLTETAKAAGVAIPSEGITELAQFTINEIASRHLNSGYEGATREEFIETTLRGMAGGGGTAAVGRGATATAQYAGSRIREYQERVDRPTTFTDEAPDTLQREAEDLRDGIGGRSTIIVNPNQVDEVRSTLGSSRRDVREYQNEDGTYTITTNPEITGPLNDNASRAKALDMNESLDVVPEDAKAVVVRDENGRVRFDEAVRIENLEAEVERLKRKYKGTNSTVEVMEITDVQAERSAGIERAKAQEQFNQETKAAREEAIKAYQTAVLANVDIAPTKRKLAKPAVQEKVTDEVVEAKPVAKREFVPDEEIGTAPVRDSKGNVRPVKSLLADAAVGRLSLDSLLQEAEKAGVDTALIKQVEDTKIDRYQVAKALINKGIYPTGLGKDGRVPTAFDVARSKISDKELVGLARKNKTPVAFARETNPQEMAAAISKSLRKPNNRFVKEQLVKLGLMETVDSDVPKYTELTKLPSDLLQQALWATGQSITNKNAPLVKESRASTARLIRAIEVSAADNLGKHKPVTSAPDKIAAAPSEPSDKKDRRLIKSALTIVDDFFDIDGKAYFEDGDYSQLSEEKARPVTTVKRRGGRETVGVLNRMTEQELDTIAKELGVNARKELIETLTDAKMKGLSDAALVKAAQAKGVKPNLVELKKDIRANFKKSIQNSVDGFIKTDEGQKALLNAKVRGIRAAIRDAIYKMNNEGVYTLTGDDLKDAKVNKVLPFAKVAIYDMSLIESLTKELELTTDLSVRDSIVDDIYHKNVNTELEHLTGDPTAVTRPFFGKLIASLSGGKRGGSAVVSARREIESNQRAYVSYAKNIVAPMFTRDDSGDLYFMRGNIQIPVKTQSDLYMILSEDGVLGREPSFYDDTVNASSKRGATPNRLTAKAKGQSETPPAEQSDVEFHKSKTRNRLFSGLTFYYAPKAPANRDDNAETVNRTKRFNGDNLILGQYTAGLSGNTFDLAGMDAFTIVSVGREYVHDGLEPNSRAEMAAAFYQGLAVLEDAANEDVLGNTTDTPMIDFKYAREQITDKLVIGVDMDSGKPVTLGEAKKAWADASLAEDRMAQYDVAEVLGNVADLETKLLAEWEKIDADSLPSNDRQLLNDWLYAVMNYGEQTTAKVSESARKQSLLQRVRELSSQLTTMEAIARGDKRSLEGIAALKKHIDDIMDTIYAAKLFDIAGAKTELDGLKATLENLRKTPESFMNTIFFDHSAKVVTKKKSSFDPLAEKPYTTMTQTSEKRMAKYRNPETSELTRSLMANIHELSRLIHVYEGRDIATWERINNTTDAQNEAIKRHNLKHLWKLRNEYIASKRLASQLQRDDFATYKAIYEDGQVEDELGRGEVEAMADGEQMLDVSTALMHISSVDYLADDSVFDPDTQEIPDEAIAQLNAGIINDLSEFQNTAVEEHTDEVIDRRIQNTVRAMREQYAKDKRSVIEILEDAVSKTDDPKAIAFLRSRIKEEKEAVVGKEATTKIKADAEARDKNVHKKLFTGGKQEQKYSATPELSRRAKRLKGMIDTITNTAERVLGMRVPVRVFMQSEIVGSNLSVETKRALAKNLSEKGDKAGAYMHDGTHGIIVLPDNAGGVQQIVTFAHELGHAFFEAHLYRADDAKIAELRRAFYKEQGVNKRKANHDTEVQFKEWAADQFVHYAFGNSEFRSSMYGMKTTAGTQKVFKSQHPFARLLRAIHMIWDKAQQLLQYKSNETFQDYLRTLASRYKANPNVTTTVQSYDDRTIYNLDPAKTMRMTKAQAARVWKNKSFGGIYRMVYTQIGDYSTRLQQMLYQESQSKTETGNTGWEQQYKFLRNRWTAAVNTQFEGKDRKTLEQAVVDLRNGNMTEDAKLIKKIVSDINKDAGNMIPMHLRKNFMVETFSSEELMARTGDFHALVAKHFGSDMSKEQVSAVVNSLIYNDGVTDFSVSPGKPVSLHANVDRLLANDAFYKEVADKGFLLNNPQAILNHYATSLAKRVAWEKQFGGHVKLRDGVSETAARIRLLTAAHVDMEQVKSDAELKKLTISMGLEKDGKFYSPNAKFHAEIDKIREKHGQEGADHVTRLVRNAMGFDGRHMPNKLRNAQGWLITYLNTLVLAFSGVASIPEIAGGNIRGAGRVSLKDTLEIIANYKQEQRRAMDLGIVMQDMAEKAAIESYGPDYQSPGQHKVHYWLFKLNGQQQLMRMSRTIATGLAERFILRAAQDAAQGKKSGIDDLAKLNVSANEVLAYFDNGRQGSIQVEQAINQFVYESVVEPSRFESTTWGNNPYMKLAWHLKQFLYSYANIILMGTWRAAGGRYNAATQAGVGTIPAAVYAATPMLTAAALLVPLAMTGQELREFIQQRDRSKNMDGGEYSALIYSKMGGFGAFEIILNMQQAAEWGRSPLMSTTVVTSKLESLLDLGQDGKLSQRELETKIRGLIPFFAQNSNAWNSVKGLVD